MGGSLMVDRGYLGRSRATAVVSVPEDRPRSAEVFTPSAGVPPRWRKAAPRSSARHDQPARELPSVLLTAQQPDEIIDVAFLATVGELVQANIALQLATRPPAASPNAQWAASSWASTASPHSQWGPQCKFACQPH